jgi:hypothetical protein
MTKRFLSLGVAVAAIALTGCGSDSAPSTPAGLCDKAASLAPGITAKFAPCTSAVGGVSIPTGTACTTAVASCSDADRAILNTLLDCLNGLPTCSAANPTPFTNALAACGDPTSKGVSAACAGTF